MARVGVDIQRTTLANWMIKTAELLSPIYLAMRKTLLKEQVIHGDETTLQVLKEPGKKAESKSYTSGHTPALNRARHRWCCSNTNRAGGMLIQGLPQQR
ncbi:IS66 family transposase [Photobacterium gaetbulicola]|uniref:IS66 family transposase n=1 Tax=Photobacterium gaetbulicola TaxID=1295392 RepID=UPI0022B1DB5F|nr:transposase [Photobacterium gaetbulicola]